MNNTISEMKITLEGINRRIRGNITLLNKCMYNNHKQEMVALGIKR